MFVFNTYDFFASGDLLGKFVNFVDLSQLYIKYWHILGKVVNNQYINVK